MEIQLWWLRVSNLHPSFLGFDFISLCYYLKELNLVSGVPSGSLDSSRTKLSMAVQRRFQRCERLESFQEFEGRRPDPREVQNATQTTHRVGSLHEHCAFLAGLEAGFDNDYDTSTTDYTSSSSSPAFCRSVRGLGYPPPRDSTDASTAAGPNLSPQVWQLCHLLAAVRHIPNSRLYANLGGAYLRAGVPELAHWALTKALVYDPGEEEETKRGPYSPWTIGRLESALRDHLLPTRVVATGGGGDSHTRTSSPDDFEARRRTSSSSVDLAQMALAEELRKSWRAIKPTGRCELFLHFCNFKEAQEFQRISSLVLQRSAYGFNRDELFRLILDPNTRGRLFKDQMVILWS